jgi:RNA polymerase sigma factor (sigma-70 family)
MTNNSYEQYEGLVMGQAWKFHRDTGIDLDELKSEAMAIFARILDRFEGDAKAFSTYLYRALRNGLIDFCKKWKRCCAPAEEINWDLLPTREANPYQIMRFKDAIANLSEEGQEVVDILLSSPAEILVLSGSESPKAVRGAIYRHLRHKRGWSEPRIFSTFREIKGVLK